MGDGVERQTPEDVLFSRTVYYDRMTRELDAATQQFGSWEQMPTELQATWRKRLLGAGFTYEGPHNGWFPPNSVDLSSI